jgi:hypothetical protein
VGYLNGYTVKLRAWDEEHDITQYVVSFTTESVAGLGQLGSARCAITLNNQTGAFTPYEVGGQGTYSNDNLFGYCLTIEAEIDETPSPIDVTVFDGVIRNVAMSGNVYNSTVTLTCTDWVAVSSGVPANTVQAGTAYDFDDTLEYVMNGSFSPTTFGLGLDLPTFGATSPAESFQAIPMGPVSTQLKMPATSSTTAHDLLANTVLTSGPFVTWPGEIIFTVSPAQIQYNLYTLDRTLTRTFSVTAMQFGPDLSGNGIPIVDITIGYNTQLITSQTSTTSGLTWLHGADRHEQHYDGDLWGPHPHLQRHRQHKRQRSAPGVRLLDEPASDRQIHAARGHDHTRSDRRRSDRSADTGRCTV